MGDTASHPLDRAVVPFATCALDVASLLPQARWPQQIEIEAGKYMVRPRYEVMARGRRRIAHVNVERTDLKPDPKLADDLIARADTSSSTPSWDKKSSIVLPMWEILRLAMVYLLHAAQSQL